MTAPDDDKTRTHVTLVAGTMVSHYRIVEKIGAGGMGEVYLAEDAELNRKVALKFLPAHLCEDPDCRARFKREAQSAAKLSHPHIVTIHEVAEHSGRPYFVMEYLPGNSLKELVASGDLSLRRVLDVAVQVCEGLAKAHQAGVVHRDIKPANIVVDKDDRATILDFGLAAVQGEQRLTKTGSTLGTVHYMSPEQTRGEALDPRSDIFSFGVVLYEMITGRLPFRGDHEPAILYAIGFEEPEPLARYKAGVSPDLQGIVSKALAKEKTERYQHADELASDLRRISPTQTAAMPSRSATPRGRRPRVALLASAAVILLAVFLALKPWKSTRTPGDRAGSVERLAIMYFDNLTDPTDSLRLGEIATNLLITKLSESRYVEVVSSQRLYDILKLLGREGTKRVDRSMATEIAQRAHATRMLLGSILQTSPELVLTSQIIDVATGDVRKSQEATGAGGEQIFSIIDRLSTDVKTDLALPEAASSEPTAAAADLTTHSPEAYRYYLEGVEFLNNYYTEDAERNFRKALLFDSTFAMAYYCLSLGSMMSGDPAEGKSWIVKAAQHADKASWREQHYILAQEANADGQAAEAIRQLRMIVARFPDEKEALLAMGASYRGLGQVDQAIQCFHDAIALDSLNERAYNQLAYAYSAKGDFEKAIAALNEYIAMAPNEANPYDSRGDIYAENGHLDQAIASYEKALELKPDFYDPFGGPVMLGHMYLCKGEYEKAEACYQKGLASKDKEKRSAARCYLAYIPAYQGKLANALQLLDDGLAADRMEQVQGVWTAWKHDLKAFIHEEQRALDAALREQKEYINIHHRLDSTNKIAGQLILARLWAENQDVERAMQVATAIRSAVEQTDTSLMWVYWLSLGCIEAERGDLKAAMLACDRLPKSKLGIQSHYLLGGIYLRAGRLGEAVTELERYNSTFHADRVSLPIWSVKVHYLLGIAYEQSGWAEKAIENYEEFLKTWKNADPGLGDVEDAKARLTRLKASS